VAELLSCGVEISPASILKQKQQCMAKLRALPAIGLVPEKRIVVTTYRGRKYKMKVKSLKHHMDHVFWAREKEAGVASKQLLPLLCENQLAVAGALRMDRPPDPP